MKDFKDYINEGVLNDIDTSVDNMDNDLATAQRDRLRNLFPISIQNRGKHCVGIIHRGVYYGGRVLDSFIDNCCYLDGNILTIDLGKQEHEELTINLVAKNIVKEGIIVRVFDHPNRKHIEDLEPIAEHSSNWPTVNVLGDNFEIDLTKVLHYDSKIEILKIGDDTWNKVKTTWLKDSNIPCRVLGYTEYCCTIKKITKFPDRIKLPKPVYLDLILKTLKLNNVNHRFGFNGNLAIGK